MFKHGTESEMRTAEKEPKLQRICDIGEAQLFSLWVR